MQNSIAIILNNEPSDNLNEAQAILDFLRAWALSRQSDDAPSERELFGFALTLDAASMRISQALTAIGEDEVECIDRKERIREILGQAMEPQTQAG